MAEVILNKEQESLIIDFLKRWGIDSPELLVEMTDHYCEIAKERLAQGWSFEKALDSWKTKPNYLELRKIQAEYERSFKKHWLQQHMAACKKLIFSFQIIYLTIISGIIFGAYHLGLGGYITLLFVLVSIGAMGFYLYFYYSDKYARLFELRESLMLWFGFYMVIYHFAIDGGFEALWHGTIQEIHPVLIIAVLVLSFASYNLVQATWDRVRMVTDEYLSEPKKFQNR